MASTFPGRRRGDGIGGSSPMKSKGGLGSTDNLVGDDNFYSSLAAELEEESDVSEADVSKMLADMDDMDDALFGSSLKTRPSSTTPKPPSGGSGPTGKEKPTLGQTFTLDKTLEEELSKGMNSSTQADDALSPTGSPRRSSKPKSQPKKFDFGDFDEDDPLAGLLSDDDDIETKSKLTRRKPSKKDDQPRPEPKLEPVPEPKVEPSSKTENLIKDDQQDVKKTHWGKAGTELGTTKSDDQPAKSEAPPTQKSKGKSIDFDDDEDDSDILGNLGLEKGTKTGSNDLETKPQAASSSRPGRSRGKTEPEADFGDESDLLGSLGLGASPRERRQSRPEDSEVQQARNKVNELFGASSTSKILEKPPAGKQRQSQLDRILQKKDKDSASKATVKEEKEEDFSFGDYTPSSVTARPESAPPPRRSVRFSDRDDLASTSSLDRPRSRASVSPFLDEPPERPKSAAAGTTSSRRTGRKSGVGTAPSDDWLELAAGPDSSKSGDKAKDSEKSATVTATDTPVDSPQHSLKFPTKDEKKSSQVKAKTEEPTVRAPSAADYLGLSEADIDLDSLVQPKPLTPRDTSPMDATLNDPFSAPTKRDAISPFPWETSSSRPKPDKQPITSTPQPLDEFDLDDGEEEEPLQTSMMAQQIQQLQQMQQQQQHQQQHQQQAQPIRQTSSDRPPTPQLPRTQTPTEQPRDTGSQKPAQTGPKKEPQWRQQMRQKQQQQGSTDKQQLSSSRPSSGLSSYEQQAATQAANTRQQTLNPLASATASSSLPGHTPTSLRQQQQQQQQMMSTDTAWQEQLERSRREMDEALKSQQAQWANQQQSFQQQLQQQQQQAMQQQLQMQEALLKAQTASPMTTLPMPSAGPMMVPALGSYGLDSKIHQLEAEKRRLEAELQAQQQAQQQQTAAMQTAHKDYIQLLEESAGRRETRLRQEHAAALQQYEQRLKQLQDDQATQQEQQQQRIKQISAEHSNQQQQLQQTHRLAMEAVQQQHEQQLQQVKLAMQREMEAISNTQTHSKSLQAVVDQVHSASKELGSLQSHVHSQHQNQLEQRSQELRQKNQQLQALEKRLSDKEDEMNEERTRLEALVSRLEAHIRQQNMQLDEEKFRLRQEQSKLTSLQRATEEERKLAAEQLAAQQASLQQAKDAILNDQKTIMAQCLEERKALAAERAQAAATRRQLETSLQEQANKAMQVGAEQDSKLENLASERSQLTAQAASLQQQQQALQQERLQLSQRRQELDGEQRRLQQLAETLRQRSQQIQETVTEGIQAREEGQSALQAARTIEAEQATRELNIQNQLQTLQVTQRQIAQERLDLAREQRGLERMRGSLCCQLCGGAAAPPRTTGVSSPTAAWPATDSLRHTPHHSRSTPAVDDSHQYPDRETAPSRTLSQKDVDTLLSQAELGHSLTMWKMAAEKDKEFLEEESIFLETLKSPLPVGYVQKA